MKKALLAAAILAGTAGLAHANTLTVHNLTPCNYTLNTSNNTLVSVPPGVTTLSFTPDIIATKIIYNLGGPGTISIGVGIPPGFPPYANSSAYGPPPPCLSSGFYTCSWSQASPAANATLVIF